MNKKIVIVAAFVLTLFTGFGQSLLSKVPNKASVVLKYAAENFTKNTTLQNIDSYSFVKNNFLKKFKMDSLSSIKNLGINFEKDVYQYITLEDTSLTFVTLLNLTNANQFYTAVKANYNSADKPETKNGFTFYAAESDTYFGWNNEMAIIVVTSYQNNKSYYDYMYSADTTTEVAVVEPPKAEILDEEVVEDIVISAAPTQKKKTTTKGKKPVAKPKTNTAKVEALKKTKKLKEKREQFVRDSIETVKRELWYQQQDMLTKKYQQNVTEKIMNTAFNGSTSSIANDIKYTKIVEPAAHVSVWANTQNLATQYYKTFALGRYYGMRSAFGYGNNATTLSKDSTTDFNSAVNVYFEKDRMRMEQKTFSTDAELTKLGNAIMDSKQSNKLLGYINADNIGYLSMSINTEAMLNYYYTVLKQYFGHTPYINEYSDAVNLYIDFLQILIDEKGVADLTPGNYLFVLHDMKTRKVTYTDYEYDNEYNKKEIKKTKNELSPNFTFVLETRKEIFLQKLADLPLKYAKKEKLDYTAKNGYYELAFKEGELPISSLYFMVKDGKGIITTSMDVVENTLMNKSFTLDEETKNSILNNNYSLKLNTKKLIETLGPELSSNASKKVADYLLQNFGDVKMESALKDGIIQGTATMNIKGNHTNSFEFIFNLMDAINNIMEKEKIEDKKKIN